MLAKKLSTTVNADGSVTVQAVPAPPGTAVEVIVLIANASDELLEQRVGAPPLSGADSLHPLRGSDYRFDDPFSPVAADWDAGK